MLILSNIIYKKLGNIIPYQIIKRHYQYKVKGVRFFVKEQPLYENYIYILKSEDIYDFNPDLKNVSIFLIGRPNKIPKEFSYDLLLFNEDISIHVLFNEIINIFQFFNEWDNNLNYCSNDFEGIKEMMDISRKLLGGALVLVDIHMNYLYYTKDFLKYNSFYNPTNSEYATTEIINILIQDSSYDKLATVKQPFIYPKYDYPNKSLCFNLFKNSKYNARLMLIKSDNIYLEDEMFLLEYLGLRINKILAVQSKNSLPSNVYHNLRNIISNLLAGTNVEKPLINSTLREVGWKETDEYLLICFRSRLKTIQYVEISHISNILELMWSHACLVRYRDNIILLVNKSLSDSNAYPEPEQLNMFLDGYMMKAGFSGEFDIFQNLYYAYKEAQAALEIGATKKLESYYYYNDYRLEYFLKKGSFELPEKLVCNQSLLNLIDFDNKNGTEYVKTLKAYLEEKYNATHAADKLYIHRTTLLKRMDKIKEITDLNLDDWDTRLHLMISYSILFRD